MFVLSSLAPALARLVRKAGQAAAAARRPLSNLRRALRHRREVQHLAALDDQGLKDIGLTRTDVHGALAVSILDDPSRVLSGIAGTKHGQAALAQERHIVRGACIRPMPGEA